MDSKTKVKSDVLQKIIDMMDDSIVGGLKSKSPKFMKIETNDPEAAKDVVKNLGKEDILEDEESLPLDKEVESPEIEVKSEEDDEDLQRLLEMYKKLK